MVETIMEAMSGGVHKIHLIPEKSRPKYDPNMQVNEDDPKNNCCGVCKLKFETRKKHISYTWKNIKKLEIWDH
jgi:hypothetical protein